MHAESSHEREQDSTVFADVELELLNGEIFYSLREAEVLIERWRRHYNTVRPHSSLNYRPPAPETILPRPVGPAYATLRRAQQDASHGSNLSQTLDHL